MKHKNSYWQSHEFIDQLVNQLPAAIFWKDKNSVFLGCNQYFASLAGLTSPKEIIGKTDYDLPWGKHEADQYRKDDQEVMQNKKPKLDIEETQTLSDGRVLTLLTNKIPLFYKETDDIVGVLCIFHNITDRKKMEKELILSKEKAEAANYIMTEFISNMGHMLVTPFSTISGTASILMYGYADRYLELKPIFEELMQGCADWEKVYHQVINATSLAEMEVKLESISINQELNNIISILKPSASAKNLKLIFKPFELKKEDLIVTDCLKFHLILIELIANAIKFTKKGRIKVSISKKDGWYHIQIEDTGIGIPSDKLDYIFKQYTMLSRAQKHGTEFRGVGAGLFLVEQRVRLIGGKILVTSELNKGSVFIFSLPAHPNENL